MEYSFLDARYLKFENTFDTVLISNLDLCLHFLKNLKQRLKIKCWCQVRGSTWLIPKTLITGLKMEPFIRNMNKTSLIFKTTLPTPSTLQQLTKFVKLFLKHITHSVTRSLISMSASKFFLKRQKFQLIMNHLTKTRHRMA